MGLNPELSLFCSDTRCEEPLWIGMEDPGTCDLGELEIDNQVVSIHCYDDTKREELRKRS